MRPFRTRFEIVLFWLPLVPPLLCSWFVGTSIHSYQQIPLAFTPLILGSGVVLLIGGIIGLYQPTRFNPWFDETQSNWRGLNNHMLSLAFGCWLSFWGAAAMVTGINRVLVA
jgi:hypothetical protein